MKGNHRQISILIFFTILILSGCTHHKFSLNPVNTGSHSPAIPLKVELSLDPDLCNYTHVCYTRGGLGGPERNTKRVLLFESTLCDYSEKIIKKVFSEGHIVSGAEKRANVDFVITPRLVGISTQCIFGFPVEVVSEISIEWKITDPNGKLVAIKEIKGTGRDIRLFGSLYPRFQQSLQAAIDDLFQRTYDYFISSSEILLSANLNAAQNGSPESAKKTVLSEPKKIPIQMRFEKAVLSESIREIRGKGYPENITNTFSSDNSEIIASVKLMNLSGKHNIKWDWIAPDNSLYYSTGNKSINAPDNKYLKEVTALHRLGVRGKRGAAYPGAWKVNIYLDDKNIATAFFKLEAAAASIKAMPEDRPKPKRAKTRLFDDW